MSLIDPGKLYVAPTTGLLVLTAKADAGDTIDDVKLQFSNVTQVVAVFGKKPGDAGSLLEVRIVPDPDIWDDEGLVIGGAKIEDAVETVHFQEPVPITPPGYMILRTTGTFTGSQYISIVARANTSQSGL